MIGFRVTMSLPWTEQHQLFPVSMPSGRSITTFSWLACSIKQCFKDDCFFFPFCWVVLKVCHNSDISMIYMIYTIYLTCGKFCITQGYENALLKMMGKAIGKNNNVSSTECWK